MIDLVTKGVSSLVGGNKLLGVMTYAGLCITQMFPCVFQLSCKFICSSKFGTDIVHFCYHS